MLSDNPSSNTSDRIDLELLDLDVDDPEAFTENVTIDYEDTEHSATETIESITDAHDALTEVRQSALTATAHLDDEIENAKEAGNPDRVQLLEAIRHNMYGLFLRLHRGEAELSGQRDGKFSDYYSTDA